MMRPAVDPFDHGEGGPFQFVKQATLYQPAEHAIPGIITVKSKPRDIHFAATT